MSVIIRLQNLPLTAASIDIRNFFRGLSIPDGGVHIVGGPEGDAFIAFTTDEDARQAMRLSNQKLKDTPVQLWLSSRNEMFKVIEDARLATTPTSDAPARQLAGQNQPTQSIQSHQSQLLQNLQTPSNANNANANTQLAAMGMLGMEMGMNGSTNYLAQNPTMLQAMNSMSPALASMGLNFPLMQSSTSNGMGGVNPTAAMMQQHMMNLAAQAQVQVPNAIPSSRPFNGVQQMGIPGINPAFLAGATTTTGMNTGVSRQSYLPRPPVQAVRGRNPMPIGHDMRPVASVRPDNFNRDMQDRSTRSSSRERRDRDRERRRRSNSRDRDRIRRSLSKSRSRSPRGRRRDSREKDDRRRGGVGGSPERIRGNRRNSKDIEPPATPFNMTDEHYPAIKLTGVPSDTSSREIKDFLRVEIMGGRDGMVRLFEEGIAYIKLERPSDFPRAYRSNGRKLRNSLVSMEGISIERWVDEYKQNKLKMDRDIDRDRESRSNRDDKLLDRDNRERGERNSSRPSRFNSAPQSSFIVIRNLPPTVTSRDMSSRFLNGIPLADIVLCAGPLCNGRHTAVAYAKLDSLESAQKAIDFLVRSPEGSTMVVEVSTFEEFSQAKIRGSGKGEAVKPMGGVMGDAQSIFDLESGLDDESCSVMLNGAPPGVCERDVYDFFSDIGLMPTIVKIMYSDDGTCNGQVLCEFHDPHLARRATTKDGMLFGRGHVKVELVPSGRRRISDPSMQMRNAYRPSLLGPRPFGGAPGPRFNPPGPNPFVQALQSGPRGPTRARPPNPSRFGSRSDFSSVGSDRDDRMGSRVRGYRSALHHGSTEETLGSDASNFGKPGCVLALENVPYKASMDDILQFLSTTLNIDISRERIIRRFDDNGKSTGDARVGFNTPAEAKLAHDRLVGSKMWNRLISFTIV